MAFDVWKGPGGTAGKPRSGDFAVGSNWSTGEAPDATVNAVMGPGKYSVAITSAGYAVGSLSVGTGVSFHIDGPGSAPASLTIGADSVNSGDISILGSVLAIASGATFLNLGTIHGIGSDAYIAQISGGTIQNAGLISTDGGPAYGDLGIFSQVINDAGGVISTVGGGRTALLGSVTNNGLVSAVDGGVLTFSSLGFHGSTTNFTGGVLNGGAWSTVGLSSVLDLYGPALTEIQSGAVVTLKGAGSHFQSSDSNGVVVAIETSLGVIGDSSSLIINDRDYTTANDLDVSGRLALGGGVLTSGGMTIHDNTGCVLTGYGVVDAGSFDIYGGVKATRNPGDQTLNLQGDARVYGVLSGPGTLEFSEGHVELRDGARVFSKSLLISGGALELGDRLAYDNQLTMTGGSIALEGHVLRLEGQVSLGGGAEITGAGVLQLEGAAVRITEGGATISSAVRNDGVIDLGRGSLTQVGAVNGIGEFTLGAGDTLTFAAYVSEGQRVTMNGRGATLDLQNAHDFHASVAEFGARDTIHLEGFEIAGEKLSFKADSDGMGGTLKVTSGADTASFHLEGEYAASGFHLADDGDGGSNLTYAPPSSSDAADMGGPLDAWSAGPDGWVI